MHGHGLIFNYQKAVGGPSSLIKTAPTARHFFVDSNGGGSTTSGGLSPESAFTTLASAVDACTASKGDTIHVMPGHAETLTAATTVADVAGIRIIGYGWGRLRPKFTFTTSTAASFDITAANVLIENLVFINGIDAQTAMVNITAADCTMRDCEFALTDLEASSTTQAVLGILASDAGDRMVLERLHMHGEFATGVTSAISYGACDNVVIRHCWITGNHTTSGSIANSAAAVGGVIEENFIVNLTADADNKCIVLHASTNSLIANNRLACIDSIAPIPITAAAGYISGNYITGAAGVTASTLK
jgi:hypothetical protein